MKHDVHIYATVRVKVCGVEADTPQEAAKKADEQTDLHAVLGEMYAEEVTSFLVDTLDEHGKVAKETDLDGEFRPIGQAV